MVIFGSGCGVLGTELMFEISTQHPALSTQHSALEKNPHSAPEKPRTQNRRLPMVSFSKKLVA
jgi:hypothetical protein